MERLKRTSRLKLLRCFCNILLVFELGLQEGSLLEGAYGPQSQLGREAAAAGGLGSITLGTPKNIVHRAQAPVNLQQFDLVQNDVELFHKALQLRVAKYASRSPEDVERERANEQVDEQLLQEASPSLLARIKKAASDFIASARKYYNLIKRYHNWRFEWIELRKRVGTRRGTRDANFVLKDYLHVLRLEYARLDEELMQDACQMNPDFDANEADKFEREIENLDFLLKILTRLIRRLERKLNQLRNKSVREVIAIVDSQVQADASAEVAIDAIERQMKAASDRAKRIVARPLAHVTVNEFLVVARLLAINSLASLVSNLAASSEEGSLTARLEPIVLLLANANASVMSSYLRDVQFRAGLNLVSYVTCKLSPRPREVIPAPALARVKSIGTQKLAAATNP